MTRRLLLASMLIRDVHAAITDTAADNLLTIADSLEEEAVRLSQGINLALDESGVDMHKLSNAIRRLAMALDPELDGRTDRLPAFMSQGDD